MACNIIVYTVTNLTFKMSTNKNASHKTPRDFNEIHNNAYPRISTTVFYLLIFLLVRRDEAARGRRQIEYKLVEAVAELVYLTDEIARGCNPCQVN